MNWSATMLTTDIVVLVCCLISVAALLYIWQNVKGVGRIVLIVAWAYISVLRGLVVLKDLGLNNIVITQLSIGFYVLSTIGLVIIAYEVKTAFKKGGKS